jgi:hypothetical protein
MSFSLHESGAAASKAIEDEITKRKSEGAQKLLRAEAEKLAMKAAGETFIVDEKNIATLLFYVPGVLDKKGYTPETITETIHRYIVQAALEGWQSTIDWNVAKQHGPYDIAEVIEIVPKAIKYHNRLPGRHPEVHVEEDWVGLALLYFEDRTPDRLWELGKENTQDVCKSLGRQLDELAWSIRDAVAPKSLKRKDYHRKLVELMDMLYMIGHGQINEFDVSWPQPKK